MTRNEKLFLAAVFLAVVVTVAMIAPNAKSREALSMPSPVDWGHVSDEKSRTMPLSWQGIIAHPAGQDGSWIQRNLERCFSLKLKPIFMDNNAYRRRP